MGRTVIGRLKIIFDFDNTLFDATQLKFLFRGIGEVNGFSSAESREIYRLARNEKDGIIAITLDRYCDEVRRCCEAKGKKVMEAEMRVVVDEIKKRSAKLLLPGASELIEFCRINNYDNYLLSLGVRAWQLEKMGWVGMDKIFAEKNTVFTVNEQGGKAEALRALFGDSFVGTNAVLFNDRADESAELLGEFSQLRVFLRCDPREERSSNKKVVAELVANYPGRVVIADNLKKLLKIFKNYVN